MFESIGIYTRKQNKNNFITYSVIIFRSALIVNTLDIEYVTVTLKSNGTVIRNLQTDKFQTYFSNYEKFKSFVETFTPHNKIFIFDEQ